MFQSRKPLHRVNASVRGFLSDEDRRWSIGEAFRAGNKRVGIRGQVGPADCRNTDYVAHCAWGFHADAADGVSGV